jgi:putative transcriptional regulator
MTVIRFRLTELLSEKAFREGRRIEWKDVADATGIHKATLSRMLNVRGYNAGVSSVDSLCRYFNCQVGDLLVYVPDTELQAPPEKGSRGVRRTGMRKSASAAAKSKGGTRPGHR